MRFYIPLQKLVYKISFQKLVLVPFKIIKSVNIIFFSLKNVFINFLPDLDLEQIYLTNVLRF